MSRPVASLRLAPPPGWNAANKGGGGETPGCECTAECGDDERVATGRARPCGLLLQARADLAASRERLNSALTGENIEKDGLFHG